MKLLVTSVITAVPLPALAKMMTVAVVVLPLLVTQTRRSTSNLLIVHGLSQMIPILNVV